jgi:predicted AlkP superfamily pyrophosphatase or phosphodiesterase
VASSRAILISIDGLAGFYWDDPRASMPHLRALAERGALARRMETVFPSTTWPSHATLVTGVTPDHHGVVANHILNRATNSTEDLTGDPVYDAAEIFRVPTIHDVAHAAGLRTAAIDWPGTRHAASLDFNLPFFKDQVIFETHTSAEVWKELTALGYPMDRMGEWAQLPKRFLKDMMVGDLADHVLTRYSPDLLLVHFLCTDSFQHLHGPRSPEAYWAIAYVDGLIGRLLERLPNPDRTTIFVVSDHGFLPVAREIRPNVRLRRLGALSVDGAGRIDRADARFVMNHGAGILYVIDSTNRVATARHLAAELRTLEGIANVWTVDEYAGLGLPAPAGHVWMGDALLEAAPGYVFMDDVADPEECGPTRRYLGTHGQLPSRPDNGAFFVAAGAGIRRGVELPTIANRDVAPTIAVGLGLRMESISGHALTDVLG